MHSAPIPRGYIVPGQQLDRRLQILLALGLLGPMRRHQLQRIAGPEIGRIGFLQHLKNLRLEGYVWMTPMSDPLGLLPINRAYLYALTPKGSALLREYIHIPPSRLITKHGELESTQRVIHAHMLDQVEFTTQLIADLRSITSFVGIDIWPEYTALGHVRIDALIIVRYALQGGIHALPASKRGPRWTPWLVPGESYPLDERFYTERLFALEVDRTTEELSVIRGKGADYRTAYADGMWRDLMAAFPIPTFLVKSERRLVSVHDAFQRGWWNNGPPQGRAVCYAATFQRLGPSVLDGHWIDDVGQTVNFWGQPFPGAAEELPHYRRQLEDR